MKAGIFLGLALIALLLSGCGSARYGEPLTDEAPVTETGLVDGKQIFQEYCHQCHPDGESGIGPALNNKPLPRTLIGLQIRKGLGAMPGFSDDRISEEEMENLIDYVQALRAASAE